MSENKLEELKGAHNLNCDHVLDILETNIDTGLTNGQVEERRKIYGRNELPKPEQVSLFHRVKEQFEDLLVRILLVSAVISFTIAMFEEKRTLTDFVEPFVILLILIANAIIGVWQESNADNALEALKDLQPKYAHVIRNSEKLCIESSELVPGDIVEVKVGDAIPADLRLLKISSALLKIDEALLTGEGKDVKKTTAQLDLEEDAPKYKKANILFSSTIMMYGRGLAVVCFTGVHTEVGKIQILVKEAQENEVESPLKKRLNQFGELLSKIIGIICFLVWAMNITNFNDPMHGHWFRGCIYYLKIAISLAVAAIPEGLPAVITTCLALGTRKMAANNAIVRKLLSVETLGCTTIICSDKTGTLTRNEMTVTKMFLIGDGIEIRNVKGNGLEPKGAIQGAGARSAKTGTALKEMAKICALCNNSTIRYEDDKYKRLGEATEAALKVLAEKIGKYDPEFKENYDIIYAEQYTEFLQKEMTTLQMLEFSRERKCMSALIHEAHNGNILLTKGAPERLLDSCKTLMHENGTIMPLTKELKDIIKEKILQLSKNALRCIGFSIKTDLGSLSSLRTQEEANEHLNNPEEFSEIECGGTFIGVAGMMDPARGEVPKAIKQCKTAGISVVMITGDNQDTANAIARDIGILPKDLKDIYNYSFSGQQFEKLEKEEQQKAIRRKGGKVFARVEPKHKQDLVKLFIEAGHIVAMTGDGVNDAAALEQAHIGIAMGVNGTDVAKEASDMVLADDNFATIVMAVEEGRSIYSNTKAFIRYLISSNIGEVASIFITALLGMPEGLNSVQLLWVNLVTDGLPATALGFNPPEPDTMEKPPRKSDQPILDGWILFRYMVVGLYVGIATVGIFAYWYMYDSDAGDGHTLVTFSQLANFSECKTFTDFFAQSSFGGVTFEVEDIGGVPSYCNYFLGEGKSKACTLSLSVLVTIEMMNAFNALSENGSLLQVPPSRNWWLILAVFGSMAQHCLILYIPFLSAIFGITPLTWHDWKLVLAFSFPVIIIDELLKIVSRIKVAKEMQLRLEEKEKEE